MYEELNCKFYLLNRNLLVNKEQIVSLAITLDHFEDQDIPESIKQVLATKYIFVFGGFL